MFREYAEPLGKSRGKIHISRAPTGRLYYNATRTVALKSLGREEVAGQKAYLLIPKTCYIHPRGDVSTD